MADRQWVIGSDTNSDLWIDESVVSRRHCRLSRSGDRYFIEDLASRNGTFIGNERVVTRTEVRPGSAISLAGSVAMPWPDEQIAKQVIRVGRLDGNDVVIDDDSVSATHAIVMCDPNDQWIVQDLGSTNGTTIGHESSPIQSARVTVGETIRFGEVAETLHGLRRLAPLSSKPASSRAASDANTMGQTVLGAAAVAASEDITKVKHKSNQETVAASHSPDGGTTVASHPSLAANDAWSQFPLVPRILIVASLAGIFFLALWKTFAIYAPAKQSSAVEQPVDDNGNQVSSADSTLSEASQTSLSDSSEGSSIGTSAGNGAGLASPVVSNDSPSATSPPSTQEPPQIEQPSATPPPADIPDAVAAVDLQGAMKQSLYWVTVSNEGRRFRVGTAIAVDEQRAVTSAAVAERIGELEGFESPELFHISSGFTAPVASSTLHPEFVANQKIQVDNLPKLGELHQQVQAAANQADPNLVRQRDELYQSVFTARELSRVFNLAVLISSKPLEGALPAPQQGAINAGADDPLARFSWLRQPGKELVPMQKHRMIGSFFDSEDAFVGPETDTSILRLVVQPLMPLNKVNETMPLMWIGKRVAGPLDEDHFDGCPITDRQGRLVGIYASDTKLVKGMTYPFQKHISQDDIVFDWVDAEVIAAFLASP